MANLDYVFINEDFENKKEHVKLLEDLDKKTQRYIRLLIKTLKN